MNRYEITRQPAKALAGASLAVAMAFVGAQPAFAEEPKSSDPIRVVVNNWGSQLVLSHVSGTLFEEMGYRVEYVPSNTQIQFPAIGTGDVHVQVEVWEGTMRPAFEKEVSAGAMIDAGTHDATTREDWWYPAYMEELCPGLPNWEALKDCAGVFELPETAPKGRFLGGAAEWEKHDEERIAALDLPFEVIYAGSTSALIAELEAAYDRKAPLLMFNYKPNWVLQKYDGKFVEFPEWAPECTEDPAWGVNPDAIYDCGNATAGWLKKAAWSGMADKYPCALEMLKVISFTDDMIGDGFYLMDVDGLTAEQGAVKWMEKYSRDVQGWRDAVPAECKAD